jgi:hypothetical protein
MWLGWPIIHFVAQAELGLTEILLSQSSKLFDYRYVPSSLADITLVKSFELLIFEIP